MTMTDDRPDAEAPPPDEEVVLDLSVEQLEALTGDQLAEYADGTMPPFRVDNDRKAAWALRKIREAVAEENRLNAVFDAEIERLERRIVALREQLAAARRGPIRTQTFMRGLLIDYRLRLEDANPKLAKTYRLPGGRLLRRKLPDQLAIVDESALVAWLKGLPDDDPARKALKVSESALVSELRKVVVVTPTGAVMTADSEPIPGLVHAEQGDTYDVKLDDEGEA